jgi:phenylalanyl-tRNA synthetase beta chain
MKISINWLRDFVSIPENTDLKELGKLFTFRTAEIEHTYDLAASYEKMVVGQIKKIEPHPNADKLKIAHTDVGTETLKIVCGGPNIKEGMYVPVALIGAQVRWHGEGDLVTLEKAKIRGEESFGMICAGEEIGLAPTPEGILDLSTIKNTLKVGQPLAKTLGKNDFIFEVDNKSITHRPDLWGHYGIAREVAAITGEKLKPLKSLVKYPATSEKDELSIKVEDKKLCPRYIGVKMQGIKIESSPAWMQQKLEAIGYRPISNIVDATNYVMAELGQPMHAFDANKIDAGIVVRRAKKGEKIDSLDGVKRTLTEEMLVIADHKKPIAIAGVMGGANSEISENTTTIILESANFNPSSVRRTSTALGLRTESVQRFEKSLDPALAGLAMDRLIELIQQICPEAKIVSPKIDIKNYDEKPKTILLDTQKLKTKIGAPITAAKATKILESLEFQVAKTSRPATKNATEKEILKVTVPSFRATKDVSIEEDLVEEIARLYGYENIESILPDLPTKLPEENVERILKHKAREILSLALGFTEVYNYSFYSIKDIQKSMIPEELHVRVENYLSEDQTHMRVSLVPNMLKNVAHNLKNKDEFTIYEIGRTYEDLQEYFPIEEKKICGIIVKKGNSKKEGFYEAKGALESLLSFYDTEHLQLQKASSLRPYAHPNKYAAYYSHQMEEEIAHVYELHPLVAKNYGLENAKVAIFEINFSRLAQMGLRKIKYRPIPKFPPIEIDVSVLMNKTMPIEEILKQIKRSDKELIQSIELFDLYEGQNIPANKKSAAFKVLLLSQDRTLTDEDMKGVQSKIFANIKEAGGEIRGA